MKILFDDDDDDDDDDDSLRNRLAEEGRVHALKNFTFEKMIETTEHVYLDLMRS